MKRCVYCNKKIWPWQERTPDENGYIHSGFIPGCFVQKGLSLLGAGLDKISRLIDARQK